MFERVKTLDAQQTDLSSKLREEMSSQLAFMRQLLLRSSVVSVSVFCQIPRWKGSSFPTILLDLDQIFKILHLNFGLAKDGQADGKSQVSTRVMGTYEYAAPEYMATGSFTMNYDWSLNVKLQKVRHERVAKFSTFDSWIFIYWNRMCFRDDMI